MISLEATKHTQIQGQEVKTFLLPPFLGQNYTFDWRNVKLAL